MDGYPSTPLNLSDGTTVTQAGGGEDETDDEKPFAQVGDLEARWHALTGEERTRAETLLQDASDLIRTTCPQWANAKPATSSRPAALSWPTNSKRTATTSTCPKAPTPSPHWPESVTVGV